MHFDPCCLKNKHKCKQVCTSASCKISNPFVCVPCGHMHDAKTCSKMPYKKLIKNFHKIQGIYTQDVLRFQERVQNLFQQLMNNLKAQFINFREQFEYINITESIKHVYENIRKNSENELNGQIISKALRAPDIKSYDLKVRNQLQMRLIKQDIIQAYQKVVQKLPNYYSLGTNVQKVENLDYTENQLQMIARKYLINRNKFDKDLILGEHFQYLQQMMNKKIYNIKLLFKASQRFFLAEEFHQRCDGISNTITIAKTQYGNIVIGFCPFAWKSPKQWEYIQDTSDSCFLISPSPNLRNLKFTPLKTKFAIGMHKDYGPCFGDDFVIYDKSEHSHYCWSNFPDVYTCKTKKIPHSIQVLNDFVGTKDHYEKFNIVEWEVYKIYEDQYQLLDNSAIREYNSIKI